MWIKYKRIIFSVLLVFAVIAAFGATLDTGFMWDDHQVIEANPYIKSWSPGNLRHAFISDPFNQSLNYYRPFETLSHMLDFSFWGLKPAGYHATNLLLHAASALLVFALMGELGLSAAAAFLSALLFAVNPTVIEQLLVTVGRAELASTAFTLASVLFFLRRGYLLSFVCFLSALGFKENGIITPLLIALTLWFLGKDKREYFKLLLFLAPIPFYLRLRHAATGAGLINIGAAELIFLALKKLPAVILIYLKNAFLPLNMHSHRMQPDFSAWFYASYAVCLLLPAVLFKYKPRMAIFIISWYLVNLAPKMPLLASNDLMLDHWTYLSNMGLYMAAAIAAAKLIGSGGVKKTAACAAAGSLVIFWITLANANIRLRNTDIKIYEHSAQYSSSKPMLYNLAREYYLAGQFAKSRNILTRISSLDPDNIMYQNGLALSLWKTGGVDEASALMDRILARRPDNAEALFNKACVLMEKKNFPGAERLLKHSVEKASGSESAYTALSGLYLKQGKEDEALAVYTKLLDLDPCNLEALNNAGIINAKKGRYAAAEELFKRVLKIEPGAKRAAMNLERLQALKK